MTYALATQLVVTLPGAAQRRTAQAELAAIWAELQAFGEQIEGVPLAELRDRLTEFEARILDVVRPGRRGLRRTPPAAATATSGATGTRTVGHPRTTSAAAGGTDAPAAHRRRRAADDDRRSTSADPTTDGAAGGELAAPAGTADAGRRGDAPPG